MPVRYLYDDYAKWKDQRLYPAWEEDAPRKLGKTQFAFALRELYPSLLDRQPNRTMTLNRYCPRDTRRKCMLMYRGVIHPEAFYIHHFPGRPPHDRIPPIPSEAAPNAT